MSFKTQDLTKQQSIVDSVLMVVFLFYYFLELIILLICGGIFDLFSSYQHEFLLVEKYSRLIVIAVFGCFLLFRMIREKRVPIGSAFSLLFIGMVFVSTLVMQGKNLPYDYFTKLSLLECVVTIGFIFHLGSLLSKSQMQKLIRISFTGTVYLVLFMNIVSLLCYFIPHSSESIRFLGIPISLPSVFYDSAEYRRYLRYAGFYGHPNTLGTHCCLAIILSFYLQRKKQINFVSFILTLGTSVFLILISHSRTGFVELGYITLFFLYELLKEHVKDLHKRRLVFLGIMVLSVGAALFVFRARVTYFIDALFRDPYQALNSASSQRMDILVEVIRMVKQSPLIGSGWNVKIIGLDTAHNMFLTAVAWTGFIGLFFFVGLVGNSFAKGIQHKVYTYNPWLWCLFTCVLIQCQFEQGIIGDMRHAATYLFWLSAGCLAFLSDDEVIKSDCSY